MLIHVIADYGPGDLAFAEVAQRIRVHPVETELLYTPVPPFATITAGFCAAQLGLKAAYRLALNGYMEATREAYRKTKRGLDRMPFSPKQRQGGKEVDASLYVVASSMGVAQSDLEKLLAGRASVGIAKKLGVSRMDLQRFIGGEVSMTMAYALGMLQPQAQDLRDYVQREGAIGIIIGMCAKAP